MKLPRMVPIRIRKECPKLTDVGGAVASALDAVRVEGLVKPGERIAVTAGSRGIYHIDVILKTVIDRLKSCGAVPFIVPAMGSHAGATAEGQKDFIAGYDITEARMGCPILSSMDAVELGRSPLGVVTYCDRNAYEADGIVVVNRVKPHTGFAGTLGSGLLKMLAIGLGKRRGAESVHQSGVDLGYEEAIRDAGLFILSKIPIRFGVAIVENQRGETADVEAVPPAAFEAADERLLERARDLMGRLPVDFLHLLIVDWMGKNLSGTGMDPNVIGRGMTLARHRIAEPRIIRIFVRDLTDETHGNAIGIGFADFATDRLVEKIDPVSTWINCCASVAPEQAHVPIHYASDREAIEMALQTSGATPTGRMRVIRIRDTEHIDTMLVSESVFEELKDRDDIEALDEPREMIFDDEGNLTNV